MSMSADEYQQAWEDGYSVGYEDGSEDTWRSIHDGQDDHDAEDLRTAE